MIHIIHYFVLWQACLQHFLLCCYYLQVVSLLTSFTVDKIVHLVINCVQKTKTIQVFFEKITISHDFPFSLPLLTITQTNNRSYSSEHQKPACVVVSFEVNRHCSIVCHSLIECWTHFNNLRLLLVNQPVMLDSSTFFDTSAPIEILIDLNNLHTVTTNPAYVSEILWCSFLLVAAALSSLNKRK